ncbi:uncharacterized protein [Antedon mediterranea]|uniref:uncharacterized protein n=1 Tax=Antedon mediterranea TaxID=105859 RepID=UPI003AF85B81
MPAEYVAKEEEKEGLISTPTQGIEEVAQLWSFDIIAAGTLEGLGITETVNIIVLFYKLQMNRVWLFYAISTILGLLLVTQLASGILFIVKTVKQSNMRMRKFSNLPEEEKQKAKTTMYRMSVAVLIMVFIVAACNMLLLAAVGIISPEHHAHITLQHHVIP